MTPKEEFFRVEAIKYLINLGYPKENFYIEPIVKKFGNGGRNSFRNDFAILKKPKSQYNNFDPDEIMKEVILLCEVKRDNAAKDILYQVLSNRGIGMAYENVQKLEKTVENNRKSVKNMKQ